MAEALLRHKAGDMFKVVSAGIEKAEVHPLAIRALKEIDVDTTGLRSKVFHEFLGTNFDLVVTVCSSAETQCPNFPGSRRLHWPIDDPDKAEGTIEEKMVVFCRVRDELSGRIDELIKQS